MPMANALYPQGWLDLFLWSFLHYANANRMQNADCVRPWIAL